MRKLLSKISFRKVISILGRKNFLGIFLLPFLLAVSSPFLFSKVLTESNGNKIFYDINEIPSKRVAIVFGAGLRNKNTPSHVLEDRILTAIDLYKNGKVQKIIMSGDNRFVNYDEPSVMMGYAKKHGIPESDLQPDYAGRRTYDTCFRAKNIFDIDNAILVTQKFHLPRALYTCNSLGINSLGIVADKREYQGARYMEIRDILALTFAIWDVNVRKPEVVLGDKIHI